MGRGVRPLPPWAARLEADPSQGRKLRFCCCCFLLNYNLYIEKWTNHECASWQIFTKGTHLCHQYPDQETEHYQNPRSPLCPLPFPNWAYLPGEITIQDSIFCNYESNFIVLSFSLIFLILSWNNFRTTKKLQHSTRNSLIPFTQIP